MQATRGSGSGCAKPRRAGRPPSFTGKRQPISSRAHFGRGCNHFSVAAFSDHSLSLTHRREEKGRTIEIWPDAIEGGDTERDGQTFATMRFIDHEAETAVVVFLQAETERGMIADLYGWAQSRGMTGQSN